MIQQVLYQRCNEFKKSKQLNQYERHDNHRYRC
jgi:hypothetical protein